MRYSFTITTIAYIFIRPRSQSTPLLDAAKPLHRGDPTDQSPFTTAIDPEIEQSVIKLQSDIKKTIENNNKTLQEVQSEFEHLQQRDKQQKILDSVLPIETDLIDITEDDDEEDDFNVDAEEEIAMPEIGSVSDNPVTGAAVVSTTTTAKVSAVIAYTAVA